MRCMTFTDAPGKSLKLLAVGFTVGLALFAGTAYALAADLTPEATKAAVANPGVIRIASVSTAVEGDFLPSLVKSFEAETGIKAILTRNDELWSPAGRQNAASALPR
jgi:spermidine/putrescine-binding protein